MHDKARISFGSARIVGIVVDAMAVHRQRRIPEEERFVEPCNLRLDRATGRIRCLGRVGGWSAVHKILVLGQNDPPALTNGMA